MEAKALRDPKDKLIQRSMSVQKGEFVGDQLKLEAESSCL